MMWLVSMLMILIGVCGFMFSDVFIPTDDDRCR